LITLFLFKSERYRGKIPTDLEQNIASIGINNIIYTSFIHHKGRSNNETNKQQKRKEKLN